MVVMAEQLTASVDSPPRSGLAELVTRVQPYARRQVDPRTIAQQVADVLVADVLVETKPSVDLLTAAERAGSPDGYTRHVLHTEATFSVSAVVWRPGQPTAVSAEPENAPANTLGIRRIMFAVKGIDAVVAGLKGRGIELVGELAQYEDSYRLCYVRGPEGIIVALAEQLR
jgi:hypothetical protein